MRGVVGQKWRTSGYHWYMISLSSFDEITINYLVHDVFQGIGTIDGETNKKKVSFRV